MSIIDCFKFEIDRYRRVGVFNLSIGFILISLFFTVLPPVLSFIFKWVAQFKLAEGLQSMIWGLSWHTIVFGSLNFAYYQLYMNKWEVFEVDKIRRGEPLAFEKPEWPQIKATTIKYLGMNLLIVMPLSTLPGVFKNMSFYDSNPERYPSFFEQLWHIAFMLIIEDFLFFWCHFALHQGILYKYIHKIHHTYNETLSWASEVAHPIEFFVGNLLPSTVGAIILGKRLSVITYSMWVFLRVHKTTEAHSGYSFKWSVYNWLPFTAAAIFHDYHHYLFSGNYESFLTIWDKLMGTLTPSYIKEHVKPRLNGEIDDNCTMKVIKDKKE